MMETKPLLEASALPSSCYTFQHFFDAEMAAIHRRNWFFVGLAAEVAAPGDYRAVETAGGPVILLRDRAGDLRAYANCCRHRGSLLLEGSGKVRSIACPYHAWTYGLDGKLIAAPGMERTIGFETEAHGLLPIRLETWQDLVFLNFDDDAPDLLTHLGDLPEQLGCYRFDEMVCTWRHEIECRCNWKMLVENALESYHTGLVHARTVGAQTSITPATKGNWVTLQVLSDYQYCRHDARQAAFPADRGDQRGGEARHLFHDDPADDAVCLRPGLHVVARCAPGSARPHGALPRWLLPEDDDGAAEFRRGCRAVLRALGARRDRGCRHPREAAARPRLGALPTGKALLARRPRAGGA